MNQYYPLILCLLLNFSMINAQAKKGDSDQPIQIEADEAILDYGKQTTNYKGRVIVIQGSLRIEADSINVSYNEKKQLKTLIAISNSKNLAHFQQIMDNNPKPIHAYAKKITYDAPKQRIALEKNAKIIQLGNIFKGSYIVYDAKRNQIKANKGRVSAIIQPPK